MIKLIHISDIHVNPGTLHGISPLVHFENALSHIEKYHHDADRIVITGDLTHHGDLESYQLLKARLSASSLKGNAVPRLMIGNHDKRDVFLSVFPQTKTDENGFVQYAEETAAGLFVYLDTVLLDDHRGEFCERRK